MGAYIKYYFSEMLGDTWGTVAYVLTIFTFALACSILLGNSAVYVFNRLPGKWFCDYGQTPDEELLNPTRQRVKSVPWKYVFTALFLLAGMKISVSNLDLAPAVMAAAWFLLLMSIGDIKYLIVPDQLIALLLLVGTMFIPMSGGDLESSMLGALAGFGFMAVISLAGRIICGRWAIGGADIKLFGVLGLMTGVKGVTIIFVVSTLLNAAHLSLLLLQKKIKMKDERPAVPYIALATVLYMVFIDELRYNIGIML